MAAKISSEMLKAQKLVLTKGLTPAEAARRAGITKSAIYQSAWYKEWRDGPKRK